MPFKPEVLVMGNGNWSQNALVFATKEEAEASARNLFMRWMACQGHRAVEVADAVINYRWDNEKGLVALNKENAE